MSRKRESKSAGQEPSRPKRVRASALRRGGTAVAARPAMTKKRTKRSDKWDTAPIWSLGDDAEDLGPPDLSERYEHYMYGSHEEDERA